MHTRVIITLEITLPVAGSAYWADPSFVTENSVDQATLHPAQPGNPSVD